jgi:hypothetical protein
MNRFNDKIQLELLFLKLCLTIATIDSQLVQHQSIYKKLSAGQKYPVTIETHTQVPSAAYCGTLCTRNEPNCQGFNWFAGTETCELIASPWSSMVADSSAMAYGKFVDADHIQEIQSII